MQFGSPEGESNSSYNSGNDSQRPVHGSEGESFGRSNKNQQTTKTSPNPLLMSEGIKNPSAGFSSTRSPRGLLRVLPFLALNLFLRRALSSPRLLSNIDLLRLDLGCLFGLWFATRVWLRGSVFHFRYLKTIKTITKAIFFQLQNLGNCSLDF